MVPTYAQLWTDTLEWLRRTETTTSPNIGDQKEPIIRAAETALYFGDTRIVTSDDGMQRPETLPALRVPELWEEKKVPIVGGGAGNLAQASLDSLLLELESVFTDDHPDIGNSWGYVSDLNRLFRMSRGELSALPGRLWYAVQGSEVYAYPDAATGWNVTVGGYYRQPWLDVTQTEHAAFQEYYTAWLYATIWMACAYLKLKEDAEYWRTQTAGIIASVNATEQTRQDAEIIHGSVRSNNPVGIPQAQ